MVYQTEFRHKCGFLGGIGFWLALLKVALGDKLSVNVLPDGVLLKAARPSYTLDDLVAQCDLSAPEPADMAAWSNVKPVGREAW